MTISINSFARTLGIAFAAVLLVAVPLVKVHAADLDGGDDSSFDYSVPDASDSSFDYSVPDYSYSAPDYGSSYDYSVPDSTDYSSSYPVSSSYSTGYTTGASYSSGYATGGYVTSSGYSSPSYSSSGIPSSNTNTYAPTYTDTYDNGNTYAPDYSYTPTYDNGNTSTYAPVSTCTAPDSCDTSYNDNAVTNANTTVTVTNPAPIINNVVTNSNPQPIVYQQPPVVYNNPTPVCNTCGCAGYPVCAYNSAPYVSLSQVPYTGLDLGFWGTIAYWGFLILWCLAAAYLIVVKRVQNRIFRSMNNFLFGNTSASTSAKYASPSPYGATAQHTVASTSVLDVNALAQQIAAILNPTVATSYSAPKAEVDMTDDFVLSQINRPRHA